MTNCEYISLHSGIAFKQISSVVDLLDAGATIPFLARYRKEKTGGLNEVQIAQIRDLSTSFKEIESRKEFILKSISEQGKMDGFLENALRNCYHIQELEDLYLPFKTKRKSRADLARNQGLEPLAKQIMMQRNSDLSGLAERYLSGEIKNIEDALSGARDIIAEWINEHIYVRKRLRSLFEKYAILSSEVVKGKELDGASYRDYFKHNELLNRCPSHRLLAILRGENAGFLKVKALPDKEKALQIVSDIFVKGTGLETEEVVKAIKDAYSRLLAPSLENEVLNLAKSRADLQAIQVFSTNLKQLLLAPPLGNKRILAIDPGFRTGCKLVCLNEQGELIHNETIFPHAPQNEKQKSASKILQLVAAYKIEAIAIGDGTAGRETESWIKHLRFNADLSVFMVREDGASIYSASPIGRKEFPNFDITVRGAVSIGRRLADPLSELVKIDAKSLGVGQYQHDVDQKKLQSALDDVVVFAVNQVGVDLNLASPHLLQYVSGLNIGIAEKIVEYRRKNGVFQSRSELMNIARFGAKTFEQSAGFLRIKNGKNTLDNTAIHPESYGFIEKLAKDQKKSIEEILGNKEVLDALLASNTFTIDEQEVLKELRKPARDPRNSIQSLNFSDKIKNINDLTVGMILPGIVTNVTNFGAFVNIGIKENGLIHKSDLHTEFVENPTDFISLHEVVQVQIVSIETERKRIGLRKIQS